jgi:LacI family transcriptional regulator
MRPRILISYLTRFEESTQALRGIAHYERNHQIWTAFHDDQARAEADVSWLESRQWDGMISRHTNERLVEACRRLRIPLVDLNDCEPFPGVPKVRPDNVAIGHVGAEHLLERGFRNFGFTGFSNEIWSVERRKGFIEALELKGRSCDLYEIGYPGDDQPGWASDQIAGLSGWIKSLPKPVGILAAFDLRAQQILVAADAAGVLVPDEVAVVGVNNDLIRCELSYPPLSSVQPNSFMTGYAAAAVLADLIAGREPDSMDQRIGPVEVVTRPSTDVLAIEDRSLAAAISYIRNRACSGITVEDVVKHAHASRSQLETKFRRYLGLSPQAEIRRVRIERVKQLLLETDYPLKTIAEMAGYEYVEYLSMVFRKAVGETPGEFRKRRLGKKSGQGAAAARTPAR